MNIKLTFIIGDRCSGKTSIARGLSMLFNTTTSPEFIFEARRTSKSYLKAKRLEFPEAHLFVEGDSLVDFGDLVEAEPYRLIQISLQEPSGTSNN